jgi:GT2 family glycosyltransferase
MTAKLRTLPFLLLLLPFDLLVAVCLCLSIPFCFRKHKGTKTRQPDSSKATIVILNWDGKHLLAECLPAVLEAIKHDGRSHEVLVVDNGSADGSVEFLRQNFPHVGVLPLDQNYGYGRGNNRGVESIRTDIFVLLNNDMIVDRGFLRPLLDGFSDPSVFAVTSQVFFADTTRRREETGKTRARFESGFFYLWHDNIQPEDNAQTSIPVFWAGGGSCAIDRNKYIAIGGFDPLYHPFYVEDTDLSYQAWKRGWKCILAPASRVVHRHRSTSIAKFGVDFVENTMLKNQYLFVWKNLTDVPMVLAHLLNLPRIHARSMLNHVPLFEMRAFLRAFRQLPEALLKRVHAAPQYLINDREILLRSQEAPHGPSMASTENVFTRGLDAGGR